MSDLPTGVVTFLLTDVEGSTPLWEEASEAMRAALVRHDALFEDAVRSHNGYPIRARGEGDSRFAVFPSATDAVAAAVLFQRALATETWPTPRPVKVRIGIHTGDADLRDGDYYGSTVNRCARLRNIGHGGQVLLSEATTVLVRADLGDTLTFQDRGEHRLRGLSRSERVFQVHGPGLQTDFPPLGQSAPEGQPASPSASGPGQQTTHPTARLSLPCSYPFPVPGELVDRDAELAALVGALERARTGSQVVMIGGSAGAGKSTLVGTLVSRAEAAGFLCLAGACHEKGSADVLSPFQDALADYLVAQSPELLAQELGRGAGDLAYVIPELRYHLELSDAPAGGQPDRLQRFGAALLTYLRRLARSGPVLLCVEDLHLADEATIELLRYLSHRARGAPLLLLGTFRADEVPPGGALAGLLAALRRAAVASGQSITQLMLHPFSRHDTARLATTLLGGPAGEQLHATLFGASEGNPLFVEHLLHELREAGQLVQRGGRWHQTTGTITSVPSVIGELIERRLSRVSSRCRETIDMVAVLGSAVEHRTLAAALTARPRADLLADLAEAFTAQILQDTPGGYAFSHALLRETVYWHINEVRRWHLHAQAGEAIEQMAGARVADLSTELARHFSAAERLLEVRDKALRYSMDAGRRAAALSSHREALAHFDRACQLLERDGEPADRATWLEALEGRTNAEGALGLWQGQIVDAERILQVATDPVQRARAGGAIGYARQLMGDTAGAMAAFQAALAGLDGAGERADAIVPRFRLRTEIGYLWFLAGRFKDMLAQGQELVRTAEPHDQPLILFWAHNSTALAQMGLGQLDLAIEHGEQACQYASRTGDPMRLAVAEANLGIISWFAGDLARARPRLERAVELYQEQAAERRAANTIQWLGRVWLGLGEADKARDLAEIASAHATEAHDRWAADCHDLFGLVHLLRAEWDEAEARFEQAMLVRASVGHAASRVGSLLGLGVAQQRRGAWHRAREQYEAALAVALEMDRSLFEVTARRYLGQLLCLQGEPSGPAQLDQALELIEQMPHTVEQAPFLGVRAEVNWRDEPAATRRSYLEQALALAPAAELEASLRLALARRHIEDGNIAEARAQAEAADVLAVRLGSPLLIGLAQTAHGTILARSGARDDGLAAFEHAAETLRHARLPFERAQALEAWSGALLMSDSDAQARPLLVEALRVYDELGARPAADRCRTLLAALPG